MTVRARAAFAAGAFRASLPAMPRPHGLVLPLMLAFAACGGSVAPNLGGGNDGGPGAAAPSPRGGACGPGQACVAGDYCDVGAACGTSGTCAAMPNVCTDIGQPVCGCDGQTYGNPCSAAGKGVSVARTGACLPPPPPPSGGPLFACGKIFCEATTQYCERTYGDVGPIMVSDACRPLPPSCAHTSSCSCFPPSTPCASAATCKQIPSAKGPDYGFELTCPGG